MEKPPSRIRCLCNADWPSYGRRFQLWESLGEQVMDKAPVPVETPPKSTVTNVIDDASESLQRFDLLDLQQYTQEKIYSNTASKDFHLFYVGRMTCTVFSSTSCHASACR